MSIIISPTAVTPEHVFPFRHSALSLFKSQRRIDPHAFLSEADGGGLEWQPLPCPLAATGYVPALCLAGVEKSAPQPLQGPSETAFARWFEVAASRSTVHGCPSLEDAVEKALQARVQVAVDSEIAEDLATGAVVLGSEASVICAVAAAVGTLAGVPGDGRGVITVPPDAAAVLTSTDYFRCSEERLTDVFGNVYVVNAASTAGRIYAESQAAYEVWVTDIDFGFDESERDIMGNNTEVLRGIQGYLLAHTQCGPVSAWDYTCGA